MSSDLLVDVAMFLPLPGALTYRVPAGLPAGPGCRVLAPVGTRKVMGVVLGEATLGEAPGEIKNLLEVLDADPVLPPDLLALVTWAARYYLAPPGEVARAALPSALHARERQVLRLTAEGERVLAAQEAVLRSEGDDLDLDERRLLAELRRRRVMPAGGQPGRASLLARLARRGLVAQSAHLTRPGRVRTELVLELVPGAADQGGRRAPRRLAMLQALRDRGGRARLGDLPPELRQHRALAQQLAARGLLRLEAIEVPHDPFVNEPVEVDRPPELTAEQRVATDELLRANRAGGFAAFLLHGVTGSGKTEVYLRLIAQNMELGRDALVLVPEISLTPQLAARFRARFGNQVAVLHSGLTDAERFGQWRLIRSGQVRIVVGARSAIFAPLRHLGAVIVDEEHDSSFKQAEGVPYHGRDLALVRAKQAGAVAVLGSATPSLESYHGAQGGRLKLLELRHRATPRPLPEVQIVDLRTYKTGPEGVLSAPLAEALDEVLARQDQAILFLNRRGFSSFVLCRACGHAFRCQHCSVSLTYHRGLERLLCHYCGYAIEVPRSCPACKAERIALLGLGTEQVEQHLTLRYPGARVGRLDRDTAGARGVRTILKQFARRELDILVGTQMVTKGHDFPHVTLVGVLCADLGLHFPDFRAAETTFQLLTQVAGRAGRGEVPGRVIIQTYSPEHPSLLAASAHDYGSFYRQELVGRQELSYPPTAHLAAIRFDGPDPVAVAAAAARVAEHGRRLLAGRPGLQLLGPAEAPIQKLKGRTRWLLLVKAESRPPLRQILTSLQADAGARARGGVRVSVDVDPLFLL